jgi:hypothetical protein
VSNGVDNMLFEYIEVQHNAEECKRQETQKEVEKVKDQRLTLGLSSYTNCPLSGERTNILINPGCAISARSGMDDALEEG